VALAVLVCEPPAAASPLAGDAHLNRV